MQDLKALFAKGIENEKAEDWLAAAAFWKQASQDRPDDLRFFSRGVICAIKAGDPEAAEALLARAYVTHPSQEDAELLAPYTTRVEKALTGHHRIKGQAAFKDYDYSTARHHFAALAALVPDHPWAVEYLIRSHGLAADFGQSLHALDRDCPDRLRIYITGCGRSGTWLMAAMLNCLPDVETVDSEQHIGRFALLTSTRRIHMLKRQHDSYKFYGVIPPDIFVLNVVRHPFDILTSTHMGVERYISLDRYEAEMRAYLDDLDKRPNTLTVRYEDVVTAPEKFQHDLEQTLGVVAEAPFAQFHERAQITDTVAQAMHGLRPVNTNAIGKWRRNKGNADYLSKILQESDGTTAKIATTFGYSLAV